MSGDGGPAFPSTKRLLMTLRDYFAGQALANLNLQAHVAKPAAESLAKSSYEIADAMLAEREKTK